MKKILLFLTAISTILYACNDTNTATPKSAAKQLLTFKINNVIEESNTVDQTSRNIRIVVPPKTDRKALTPTITLSAKATVSPATGVVQDFTNAVKYTVTAEDGSTQVYSVVVDVKMSSEKAITEFKFSGLTPEVKATITGTDIVAIVPSGTNVKTLVPTIMLSAGATVSPESGKATDFSSPTKFTVTAEDGTKQDYLVKITVAKSTEKQITEFRFAGLNPDVLGAIDQTTNTISATVPAGTNLKILIPTIKLSALATITPTSGTAQDFTNTVNYTVKAEDGTTQVYKVTVKVLISSNATLANMLFIGFESKLNALNALTGTKIWDFSVVGGVTGEPFIANGIIYFGTGGYRVFAVDGLTGLKKWEYTTNGGVLNAPTVVNNVVYITDTDGYLYAIDATNGKEKYQVRALTDYNLEGNSTIVDGVLYWSGNNLLALDITNGKELWRFEYNISSKSTSNPVVLGGVVYAGTTGGIIFALDAKTGSKKWSFDVGYRIYSSPTISNGILYLNGPNLYAIDIKTGSEKWKYNTGDNQFSGAFVDNGIVYSAEFGGLVSLDALTGKEIWHSKFTKSFTASPVIVNGSLYIGCYDNNIYSIDVSTAKKNWTYTTANKVGASACVVDKSGNVFYSSINGNQQ